MARIDQSQASDSPFSFSSNRAEVPGQENSVAGGRRGADPFGTGKTAPGKGAESSSLFMAPGEGDDPGAAIGYRKSPFGHKDEVSVYTAQMDAKHAMDRRLRVILVSLALTILLIPLTAVLPTGLFGTGSPISLAYVVEAFGNNITGFVNWVTGASVTTGISITFWQVCAVAVAGGALALNGCVFQGALKNALAAPSTLGIMSGATLGTLVYSLTFGIPADTELVIVRKASEVQEALDAMDPFEYLLATQGRALFSLAGCFVVVALVLLVAHVAGRGKVSKVGLVIAGQVFTALIAGVVSVIRTFIMYYGTLDQQLALSSVVGGDVSAIVSPLSLAYLAVPVFIGVAIVMAMRFRLNLLVFNDEEARSMGINSRRTRNALIIVCTVLTGVVVSFVGSIGFVGFLVPHLARKVVGPDFRYLVPTSILFGSIFLLVAYYVMNLTMVFSGSIGTLTSIIGAVAFLVIVIRERARGNVDWI